MLGHAATRSVVTTNVAALVDPPPVPVIEITILNEEQIVSVLRHLDGRTLRPIVSLLLGTGARCGEALGLCYKDIDFETNTVRIERSIEQTKAGLRIKAPKTSHGRRNVSVAESFGDGKTIAPFPSTLVFSKTFERKYYKHCISDDVFVAKRSLAKARDNRCQVHLHRRELAEAA